MSTSMDTAAALARAARQPAAVCVSLGPVPGWSGPAAGAAAARVERLRSALGWWVDDIRTVVTELRSVTGSTAAVDAHLSTALGAAGWIPPDPAPGGGPTGPGAAPGPPDPSSPGAVTRWWTGLDEPAREALRRERPDLVGGLDGLPARVAPGVAAQFRRGVDAQRDLLDHLGHEEREHSERPGHRRAALISGDFSGHVEVG